MNELQNREGDLSDLSEHAMIFHKLLIYGDFQAQPSLTFTENGLKGKKK